MNDTTKGADLQYRDAVVPGTSMRSHDFAEAALLGGKRNTSAGVGSLLLGLLLILLGVGCLFAVLRILFQPYILGGPELVLVVVPLVIIAAVALLFFGIRTLIRRTRHTHH
jgi:hypothetical protein